MIPVTDEMRAAVRRRMGVPDGVALDPWMEAAIGDVLAIVERDRSDEPGLTRSANAASRIADRLDGQARGKTGAERVEKLSQAIGARLVAVRLRELADAEGPLYDAAVVQPGTQDGPA